MYLRILLTLFVFPLILIGQSDFEDIESEKNDYFFANFQIEKQANFIFNSLEDYAEGVELNGVLSIDVLSNKGYVINYSSGGLSNFYSSTNEEMPVSCISARADNGKWLALSSDGAVLIRDPKTYNQSNGKGHPSATKECYHPDRNIYLPCRPHSIDYKVALPTIYSDGTYTIEMTYVISRP